MKFSKKQLVAIAEFFHDEIPNLEERKRLAYSFTGLFEYNVPLEVEEWERIVEKGHAVEE